LISKNARFEGMFKFLRNLQSLRSTYVAHRKSEKSKDYQKVRNFFDFDNKELQEIFKDILYPLHIDWEWTEDILYASVIPR